MDRWWTIFNRELAQRCLPRPSSVDGSYWGLWVPLLLIGSVAAVLAGFGVEGAFAMTISVYLVYLLGNAGRLGSKSPVAPADDAPGLEIFSARLAAATLPLMCEVVLIAPVIQMLLRPTGGWAWVGYLELMVLTAAVLGLNSAARERSSLQATARTWLLIGVFLLISSFGIWALKASARGTMYVDTQPQLNLLAGHPVPVKLLMTSAAATLELFNPLWGFSGVLHQTAQPAGLAAVELLLYAFLMAALIADTMGRLQRIGPAPSTGPGLLQTPFSVRFLWNCLLTSLLQEARPTGTVPALPTRRQFRTIAITSLTGLLGVGLALALTQESALQHQRHLLHTCEANEKSLAIALECYASDNQGLYPRGLRDLYPRYLAVLPTCPATGDSTYAETYRVSTKLDAYSFYCWGENHLAAGAPANYPIFSSTSGLADGRGPRQAWNSDFWHGMRHRLYLTSEPPWSSGILVHDTISR